MSNNKMYAPLVLVMGILMYLLNYCVKIALCSLVFTLLMFTINMVSKTFGFKKALLTILAYVGINLLFLSDYNYEAGGLVFNYLVPASLFAVLFSAIISMKVTSFFASKFGFARSIIAGLLAAAIADGIAMSIYFTNYLSASKIASIFQKEFAFKCVYTVAVFVVIKLVISAYGKYKFGKPQLSAAEQD
jgi:hypothetical protein